jgi:hypothetical protein
LSVRFNKKIASDCVAKGGDVMELGSALKLSAAAAFVGALMTSNRPAHADVMVDIPALQDATLFGVSPSNNNSSSGPGMFIGADGTGNPKRGLIQFDIPAFVPSNATITSASLSLVLGQVAGGDTTPRTTASLMSRHRGRAARMAQPAFSALDLAALDRASRPIPAMSPGISPNITPSLGIHPAGEEILFRPKVPTP